MYRRTFRNSLQTLGLWLLMGLLVAPQAFAASEKRVSELMEISGLEKQISQAPQAFKAGVQGAVAKDPSISDSVASELKAVGDNAFAAEDLMATFRETVAEKLTEDDMDQLMEWYRSETGRQITQAEVAASAPQAQQEMMASANSLLSDNPELVSRAREIGDLVKGAEFMVELNQYTMEAIKQAFLARIDDESKRQQFTSGYESRMKSMQQQMERQAEQMMTLSHAYAYKDIEADKLDAYISFLKTPAGRKFTEATMGALQTALKESVDQFAQAVSDRF